MHANSYQPINCEFHDVLESLATTRTPAQVIFIDDEGTPQQRTAIVLDVYARDGAEFLALDTGETVRLDALRQVDGERLADY